MGKIKYFEFCVQNGEEHNDRFMNLATSRNKQITESREKIKYGMTVNIYLLESQLKE